MVGFSSEYLSRKAVWSDIQDHLEFMYGAVAGRQAPVVIELGTRSGNSTSAFLAGAESAGGHIWSCDINDPDVPGWWRDSPLWTFQKGDDLEVASLLPAVCDVLFIDTSHEYEHTLAELREYVPRVCAGGIVMCHDTQWLPPAVSLPSPTGPVAQALDAYCAETGRAWHNRHSGPGFYGMGVLHAWREKA